LIAVSFLPENPALVQLCMANKGYKLCLKKHCHEKRLCSYGNDRMTQCTVRAQNISTNFSCYCCFWGEKLPQKFRFFESSLLYFQSTPTKMACFLLHQTILAGIGHTYMTFTVIRQDIGFNIFFYLPPPCQSDSANQLFCM
jgi:hypothetical protein